MKALLLEEWGGPLVPVTRADPHPGPGEVLVRVRACGVGYTLTNIRMGRMASGPGAAVPRIIGHEVAGEVEDLGEGVTDWSAGDRIAVYFYLTCGRCEQCRHGHDPLCESLGGLIGVARDGGLAERMVVPAANLIALPDGVSFADAAVATDAVATPWHALREVAPAGPLDTVAVVGAGGGVGIHAVQVARLLGARAIALDVDDDKLDLAVENGATGIVNVTRDEPVAAVRELTGGRGADVVLDYVASEQTLGAAFEYAARRGRVVVQGVNPPGTTFSAEPRAFIQREVALTGARYADRREVEEVMRLVAERSVRPVVSLEAPFAEAADVFAAVDASRVAGRAVLHFP
jgi:propanol-preferring alcohol dehydrogenase